MRRRKAARGAGVPEPLCRFVASEWPGACVHEQLEAWTDGCADWLAAASLHQPRPGADAEADRWWLAGCSARVLPFGEHGDGIDVLNESGRYGRMFPPCPHEIRPAQHWVNGAPA